MRSVFSALLTATVLTGCASLGDSGLIPGIATGADVIAKFGQPVDRVVNPDGASVLYYPRGPLGRTSYAAVIDANGKLQAIEQRLTDENIAKIKPGWTARQVRELLGPSLIHTRLTWRPTEVWEYKLPVEPTHYVLWVQFSTDGTVREVAKVTDPEWEMGKGGDSHR